MFAELLVMGQAVKGFLGCALVGLFLAVAHSIAGIDATQDDSGAEDGVLVGVGIGIDKFKLDGNMILLCPLDETRLEVLFGFDQIVEIEMLFNQAVNDEFATVPVALVQIDSAHKRFQSIAADVAVV